MKVKNIICGIVVLLVLDILWLWLFMAQRYKQMIGKIQSTAMKANMLYAVFAYILMCFGLYWFVMKNEDPDNKIQSNILNGALFGLMVYGIYNFTAGAVLSDWSGKVMIYDIVWGMFVYAAAASVGSLV